MNRSLIVILAVLALTAATLFVPIRSSAPGPSTELRPGISLSSVLRSNVSDVYPIDLQAGDFLRAVVDQHGVDVVVSLEDPEGRQILETDSPNGVEGPEPVAAVATGTGWHRLVVRAFAPEASGRYTLRLLELRPATGRDRREAEAAAAFGRAELLQAEGTADALRRAAGQYRVAVAGWKFLGETTREASALWRGGDVASRRGDLRGARISYEKALALYRSLGERAQVGRLLDEIGVLRRLQGEPARAERAHEEALRIAHHLGDRRAEAEALGNLGVLYDEQADARRALAAHTAALALWRKLGDGGREATALHNLGASYSLQGRLPEAIDFLRQALRLRRAAGDRRGEAATLTALAWAHTLAGTLPGALALYNEALRLRREVGDRSGEAATLDRRGTALARMGRPAEALASYQSALALLRETGQRQGEAHTLANIGWLFDAQNDLESALEYQTRALEVFRKTGDLNAASYALLGIARAERRLGRLSHALSHIEESLRLVESLRKAAPGRAFQISYLASRYDHYELCIDILMRLHAQRPGQGLDGRALEVAERARARSLLENVGAQTDTAPLSFAEIRRQVRDGDTLIEYSLGEERSFVWVISRGVLNSQVLPGRAEIEQRARKVHELLAKSHLRGVRRQSDLAARALSDVLLGPITSLLGTERLLIVPDGALQSVSFAALPVGEHLLLEDHDIVHLPSVSILAAVRRELAGRLRPPKLLAVVADPVFSGNLAPAALGRLGERSLAPLPHTRREAENILRWVPEEESLRALMFDASRETVLHGGLDRYRILHFATHALIDRKNPELSGLALSSVDEQGRPRDGLLRVGEIRGLDLPADLVVLSACRTALGREVRGEGLTSLAQAFFDAGAARVIVTLWDVEDASAAELMSRFYAGLLGEGLEPARALRRAQLSMLKEPRWRAPQDWAAFALQGSP